MKIKDKFIQCEACHKKYTINYLEKDEIKKSICPNPLCGKHNVTILKHERNKKS